VQVTGGADFALRSVVGATYRFLISHTWGPSAGLMLELPLLDLPQDVTTLAMRLGLDAQVGRSLELSAAGLFGPGLRFFTDRTFGNATQVDLRLGGRFDLRGYITGVHAVPRLFAGVGAYYLANVLGQSMHEFVVGVTLGFTEPGRY